ncbi:MAG: MntP/YtaF family protein [Gorillibacterium sp.]|nr:MntP/YtaF family protein [Gorillibacterium sp.]
MLPIVSLLILAIAVSLDGFGVGAMYGLRKIRIPLLSIIIIACCSGLVILISMKIGVWLSAYISPPVAKDIGALILVAIGIWTVFQMIIQQDEPLPVKGIDIADSATSSTEAGQEGVPERADGIVEHKRAVLSIELKRIGVVIQILRTPSIADVDRSGVISSSEATMLGLALSLDAFGAGIGAAFLGFSPFHTAGLIAASSAAFISIGLRIGFHFANLNGLRRFSVLPGFILIAMGLMKLL